MQTLSILLAATALLMSALSLLVAVGTARRLAKQSRRSTGATRSEIFSGTELPELVKSVVGTIPIDRPWLLAVASRGCPSCVNLATMLNDNAATLADTTLVVIDTGGGGQREFASLLQIPAKSIPDESGRLRNALHVVGIPHTFMVKNQRIVNHLMGDNISALLAELNIFLHGSVPAASS